MPRKTNNRVKVLAFAFSVIGDSVDQMALLFGTCFWHVFLGTPASYRGYLIFQTIIVIVRWLFTLLSSLSWVSESCKPFEILFKLDEFYMTNEKCIHVAPFRSPAWNNKEWTRQEENCPRAHEKSRAAQPKLWIYDLFALAPGIRTREHTRWKKGCTRGPESKGARKVHRVSDINYEGENIVRLSHSCSKKLEVFISFWGYAICFLCRAPSIVNTTDVRSSPMAQHPPPPHFSHILFSRYTRVRNPILSG